MRYSCSDNYHRRVGDATNTEDGVVKIVSKGTSENPHPSQSSSQWDHLASSQIDFCHEYNQTAPSHIRHGSLRAVSTSPTQSH